MNWLTLELQILNFCSSAITFAANWLLQSTLLISVGMFAAWWFHRRGSAFQSVVYRTTLFAVLPGPLVSIAMAYCGLDGWSMKLPPAFAYNQIIAADEEPSTASTDAMQARPEFEAGEEFHQGNTVFAAPPRDKLAGRSGIGTVQGANAAGMQESATDIAVAAGDSQSPSVAASNVDPTLTTVTEKGDVWLLQIHGFGLLFIGLAMTWILVSGVLAIRMAMVMWRMNRLRNCSLPGSPDEVDACQRIAAELSVAAPQVLRAPFLTSPFLHGIHRPAVMLPEDTSLPLQDIFVHELAHLRRHDCFWLVLRQAATTVLFFQPLLLWLGRRIDATAEEVCDDFVVQFGGNREDYANSLVDIAALYVQPMAITGVGIVSLRSMLGQRVGRILDTSRSLSTRVGNLLLVFVVSGGLLGTMIGGFVGLSQKSAATMAASVQSEPQPGGDENAIVEPRVDESSQPTVVAEATNAPKEEPSSEEKTKAPPENITGRIIGQDGNAVEGAKLLWYRTRVYDIDPMLPKLLAESDKDGKFSFTPPAIPDPEAEPASWSFQERIAIVAPGHGFKIIGAQALKPRKSVSALDAIAAALLNGTGVEPVVLPVEGKPLHGRIVTIEGTPVVGATVRIRNHSDRDASRNDPPDLVLVARDSTDVGLRSWLSNLLNVIEPVPERFALPSATTDANGEFELVSLPEDCLFHLLLEGDGIQSTDIIAHNAEGEKIVVESGRQSIDPPTTVYRNKFLFVAGPSHPVSGRVTDLETGEPVPNAVVRAFTVHGEAVNSTWERQHFATRTDKDGRYRISGLPIGDGNSLASFTTDDVAYIPVGQEVDTSKSDAAVEANFTLKRAVWAKGQIKDGETGNPLTGQLTYYWFRDLSLEEAIPGLRRSNTDGLYFTNIHGEFRVPVLATRGILAYRFDGNDLEQLGRMDRIPRGLGAEKIEGIDEQMNAFPTMPRYLIPGNYNFVTEINPQAGAELFEVEMVLRPSKPVQMKIVAGADGELPSDGYQVYGLNERWGWQVSQTTQPAVEDLLPNETRKVFVFHREAGLAGGVFVAENVTQPVEIKLSKSGGVKGRLLDKNGDVIADGVVFIDYEKLRSGEKYAIWANHPKLQANPSQIPVDEEGRFELDGFIPGWKYSAHVSAPRKTQGRMMSTGIGWAFVDVEINPGETRDLGDLVVGSPEEKAADGE